MKKIITICCLVVCFKSIGQSEPLSVQMSKTAMTIWRDSLAGAEAKPVRWAYDQGVVLKGIEGVWHKTGEKKYFDYMQKSMDFFVNDKGEIRTYKLEDYNIDNVLCGRILLTLYGVTGKDKYYKAATTLREQLKTQPRTNEGGFWHKKRYPYQMWLDGLYMGEPFYAEYAKTFTEPAAFDDVANQFIWMEQHARDAKTGLLYHGWDESKQQKWANKTTGLSPNFWARAMGWYGMALVDVLEQFPADHPKRNLLLQILKRYAGAIIKVQDAKTGLWWDVMDRPKDKGNYFEASASCMMVYTLAKAVRLSCLPNSYLKNAEKGYAGIKKEFIEVDANGQTNLKGTVSVSGLGGEPYRDGSYEYYLSEKVVVNDPKGVGAFIQTANEMELLPTLSIGKGKTVLLDDYFNAERKKDITGIEKPFHYKWEEQDNNGFSLLGNVFNTYGVQTKTLSEAPTKQNLQQADIYFIVDADTKLESPNPHFMNEKDASTIYDWVKAGGVLMLFHNDKGNADFEYINLLTDKFGIHLNEESYNRLTGTDFYLGAIDIPNGNEILPNVTKIYQKEICSITVNAPAVSKLKKGDINIFAVAKVGKGTVFVTGDPWLYNEYTDGRKLPAEYQNLKAANDLVAWLVKQGKK
ncbi:glycoside hydrolase family 105 protein [Chitinophagaceae bacterium LWZ2-11]